MDDHPANLIALEAILEPLDLRLVTARSGELALEQLLREDFAAILLDACMPGLDGIETARLIRQRARHRDVPILLITALYRDEAHIIQGYAAGAMDYIVKPLDPDRLRAKVGMCAGLFAQDRPLKEHAAALCEERAALVAREQAALREAALQRERLHHVFTQAPVAIAILRGPEHIYEFVNARYTQVVGRQDLLGQPVREVRPELDGQDILQVLDGVFQTGQPFMGETYPVTMLRPDGTRRAAFFDFICQPLHGLDGKPESILICAAEVTEQVSARLKAEALMERLREQHATLSRSEERFRSLTHALSQVVWTADAQGRVYADSPSWRAFTGQERERLLDGKYGWLECVHPEDRSRTLLTWKEAVRTRGVFELEHRLRRSDGKYRYMAVRGVPVIGDRGRVREWVGIHMDVTEQRRSEQASAFLAQASALLSASLDCEAALASVARLVVPRLADWTVVDVLAPDGGLQRLAVAHRDPDKEPLLREEPHRYPPDMSAARGLPRVLRTGTPEWRATVTDSHLSEEARDAEHLRRLLRLGMRSVLCVPLLSRGRILGALTLASANSEREYDEWDLRLAEDLARRVAISVDNARLFQEAREAVQARDEFLSVASHELKTPLTPLRLKLQAMRKEARNAASAAEAARMVAHLDVAERQVAKLNRLIESLLDVSRISAGKLDLELEDVDLTEVVREVAGRFEPEAAQVGSEVRVVAPRPVRGRWDRMRLEQIVTNLLTNALKYGAGKPVALDVRTNGGHAHLSVRDEGIGIDSHNLSRIFDRFERAVSERHYGGLGLGLYITRQIVEALGGHISVESTPGVGSMFVVTLPRERAERHAPASPAPPPAR